MRKHETVAGDVKRKEVKKLADIIQKYRVLGIADMTGMPSPQLQKMRMILKDSVEIVMSKGRLIRIALDGLKGKVKGIEELKDYIKGMPCLILTNDNPFKLASILKKNKSSAPARAGQAAQNDIWVRAGPTAFPPGPLLGELGAAGLKAFVDAGKIAIREDKLVVREGEAVNEKMAAVLSRLGIEPMEIGINLVATLENGEILTKNILYIDVDEYYGKFACAYKESFNLAFKICYPIKENIKVLLGKAHREALAVAESGEILTSFGVGRKLAEAEAGAGALKERVGEKPSVKEESEPVKAEEKQEGEEAEPIREKAKAEEKQEGEEAEPEGEEAKAAEDEEMGQKDDVKEEIKPDAGSGSGEKEPVEQIREENRAPERDSIKGEEEVAQDVLKKLQDQKIKEKRT